MVFQWNAFRNPGHRMIVTAVRTAEKLSKKADRFLLPFNLTLAQFNLLTVLSTHPKGLAQTRIGDELVVSRANVTGLVGRMSSRGLCRIIPHAQDGRIKTVRISTAGTRLLKKIHDPYFREIDKATKALRNADLNKVADVLDRLSENLDREARES